MSFFFGTYSEGFIPDAKYKQEYDSSLKFPNQNVTVSKSAGGEADMYDLNFGVEMPVYDVTKYFTVLKDLSVEIFIIFDYINARSPVTDDTLKQIIPILKKLLFVIQNIYDVFNAYTYTDNDIEIYMIINVLPAIQSKLKKIHNYISDNESNVKTMVNTIRTNVTEIIKLTYAAAGAVAIASSDDAKIATEIKVKTIYTQIPMLKLTTNIEAANFIDGVRAEVCKEIKSITSNHELYAAILKKSEYLDFYCNNKINVKLLFDSKKIKVGDSGPGIPGKTRCLLTQYKMKGAEKSDDSGQPDVDASSAKINYDALITTLNEASNAEGLDADDKKIVENIIKKANEVTLAKNAEDYNTKKQALRAEIAKISNLATDPKGLIPSEPVDIDEPAAAADAPADAPATITINGTVCKNTDEVKAAFNKIVGIDDTNTKTPSKLEELATEYYEFNIRESRKKDTSTSGILISTQAKIQEAIGDLQDTNSTPKAKDYDEKFKEDKVFVDMNKDDSGLVCGLPEKPKKYVFEFEFDLSEFVFDLNLGNVSTESSGSPNKNILLLHKGSWISIVFKNVHIPLKQTFGTFASEEDAYTKFDGKIKEDALMLMLSINNTDYPKPKTAGVVEATQIDMRPFKDLFFMKTNPIIFGTINDSIIEFQYVKVTGKKIKSAQKEPGFFKSFAQGFKQSVIQGVQSIHQDQTKAADLNTRKQLFMQKTRDTVNAFRQTCIKDDKVDAEKSNQYIRNLYNSNIDEGQLKNIFGLTGKMPLLIFALTQPLIPNDTNVENSMLLIVRALAGDKDLQSWNQRLNVSPIQNQTLVHVHVQGGGAAITEDNINKAAGIIKGMMNILTGKQFITTNVSSSFTNGLEAAEQKILLNTEDPDAIEITVPPPPADSTSGLAQDASSLHSSSSDKFKGILGSLLASKSRSSSASSSSDGTNMETCGNTANVTCNGENLIVTITLKTSDLLNQCGITHENILDMKKQLHNIDTKPLPQKDYGQQIIDMANSLTPDEARQYFDQLTSDHFQHITEAHIKALKPELQPIFREAMAKAMAKAKASGAKSVVVNKDGAGATNVTTKNDNDLSVLPTSIENLKVGKTQKLAISGGNGQSITYKSLSETIATVDTAGIVTGENAGKAAIQITQAESDTTKAADLTVSVNVIDATPAKLTTNTLSFTKAPADPITLDIGSSSTTKTHDLGATNVPKSDAGSNGAFTYESSNPKVATVEKDSGLVTGVGVGNCEINITQAATSELAEGKLKVKIKVVKSLSPPPPPPTKTEDEQKYDKLKAQYDAINKTREKLKDKIKEIIDKIKGITMSQEEIENEQKYNELKAQYSATVQKYNEAVEKSKKIISEIDSILTSYGGITV